MTNKNALLPIILLVILSGCTTVRSGQNNSKITKTVIVLGLDGFSVEGYHTAKLPNLERLLKDGVLSLNTRAVMPSVTLPNWTSHLTGSGPEQHGVNSNGWTLDNHPLPPMEQDSDGYYPSIFKLVKEQMPNAKTAYYYNWRNLINPINQRYLDEVNFQEDDGYSENYKMALSFAIKHKNDPTLIFLYSVHTDHAGHSFKWMSKEYITALEEADIKIGELLDGLEEAGVYDDTHFFLITDHGGVDKSHGGMSPAEMLVPWAVTGPGIKRDVEMVDPSNNTNTAAVIARIFGIDNIPKSWVGQVPEFIFVK